MTVREDVVAALAGVAGDRVYPQVAPADAPLPFVVYRVLNEEPYGTLSGSVATTRYSFAFDCYADSLKGAEQLASDVETALEGSTLIAVRESSPGDEYEYPSDVFVESVYYSVWR